MGMSLGAVLRGTLVSATLGVVMLAGCNNGNSSTPGGGGATPTPTPPATNSQIYVTEASGAVSSSLNSPDTILVFTIGSLLNPSGTSLSPIQAITSSSFSSAYGVAVDSLANIYITNLGPPPSIQEFSSNANGTSTPIRTITSSALSAPTGVALDSVGNIYVADPTGGPLANGQIEVFAAGASGASTPTRTISGSNTGLNTPSGITVSNNGAIYVTNDGTTSTVEVFSAGANGNVGPTRTISGAGSGLNGPLGVAIGPSGAVYVSNSNGASITVYGTSGSVPVRTIAGTSTNLFVPNGLALDVAGNLYEADGGPPSSSQPTGELLVFPPNATGNVTPTLTASGVGESAWGIARY